MDQEWTWTGSGPELDNKEAGLYNIQCNVDNVYFFFILNIFDIWFAINSVLTCLSTSLHLSDIYKYVFTRILFLCCPPPCWTEIGPLNSIHLLIGRTNWWLQLFRLPFNSKFSKRAHYRPGNIRVPIIIGLAIKNQILKKSIKFQNLDQKYCEKYGDLNRVSHWFQVHGLIICMAHGYALCSWSMSAI